YYPISLKILDNTNRNDTEDFLLQVNENTKPKFTQLAYIALSGDSAKTSVPDTLKMWENDTLVVTFTLDDLDDDTLTYSVTADSSELKLVVLDSSVTTTPKEIQVTFMPEQFWRKTSKIKLRASDGKVNGATRNNDTTFVMNVKHVPRPHYWLSLGQNPSFTRYYELMVTDTAEKAKGLDMYIYRDGNLPVGAVEMDSLGLYTWVGNFEFDTTANYRFEMKGDGLVGDTTVNDTATHALARASGPWRAESYDGGFTVISKAANAVPFDKPFMIVDSLLFPVGEAEDGLYRMGHPLVEFEKPVMVTILADERYPAAEQAIHQMSGGVWQELPTISRKNEIMAWTKSMGYFKIGEKTIIVPEETLLGSNYPNPFNSSTNVEFDVGFFGGPDQRIVVVIYNILGQRVKTLHDGPLAIGHHKIRWNARDMRESPVSSGLYIIRLLSDAGVTQSKKMTLIR
ncbi:MAG TPA: T9SS type A sorting domain-containing protein, partial [Candidatus Marinimicrobia bacterium]|nr:T9SS type A sorting domain-containing protein [Candidatus Neomarinimicrobiota bacterium]